MQDVCILMQGLVLLVVKLQAAMGKLNQWFLSEKGLLLLQPESYNAAAGPPRKQAMQHSS
jgi:hypothetical protein